MSFSFYQTRKSVKDKICCIISVPLARPQHQNAALEKLITSQKGESKLTLSRQEVIDEDIDIIMYYITQYKKVSKILIIIACIERLFTTDTYCIGSFRKLYWF